jgi:hypothetical protein
MSHSRARRTTDSAVDRTAFTNNALQCPVHRWQKSPRCHNTSTLSQQPQPTLARHAMSNPVEPCSEAQVEIDHQLPVGNNEADECDEECEIDGTGIRAHHMHGHRRLVFRKPRDQLVWTSVTPHEGAPVQFLTLVDYQKWDECTSLITGEPVLDQTFIGRGPSYYGRRTVDITTKPLGPRGGVARIVKPLACTSDLVDMWKAVLSVDNVQALFNACNGRRNPLTTYVDGHTPSYTPKDTPAKHRTNLIATMERVCKEKFHGDLPLDIIGSKERLRPRPSGIHETGCDRSHNHHHHHHVDTDPPNTSVVSPSPSSSSSSRCLSSPSTLSVSPIPACAQPQSEEWGTDVTCVPTLPRKSNRTKRVHTTMFKHRAAEGRDTPHPPNRPRVPRPSTGTRPTAAVGKTRRSTSSRDHRRRRRPQRDTLNPEVTTEPTELAVKCIEGTSLAEDGSLLYRVHWEGYTSAENTWEPLSSFNNYQLPLQFLENEEVARLLRNRHATDTEISIAGAMIEQRCVAEQAPTKVPPCHASTDPPSDEGRAPPFVPPAERARGWGYPVQLDPMSRSHVNYNPLSVGLTTGAVPPTQFPMVFPWGFPGIRIPLGIGQFPDALYDASMASMRVLPPNSNTVTE